MSIYRGLGLAAATAVILIIGAPVAGADRDHDGRGYWRNGGHGRGHGYGLDHREEHNRGSDANPLSEDDILAKFRDNVEPDAGEDRVTEN